MKISGEERRAQILQAAQELCAERGFSGTTVDRVAQRVGVSRSLVLQHFGSKEGIYEQLVDFMATVHAVEEDERVAQMIREKDDYGVFHAFASHVFEHSMEEGKHSVLRLSMFSLLENPYLYRRSSARRDRAWEELLCYVEERQREGAFRPLEASYVVHAFRSVVDHLAMEASCGGEGQGSVDFYPIIETVINIILGALRTEN